LRLAPSLDDAVLASEQGVGLGVVAVDAGHVGQYAGLQRRVLFEGSEASEFVAAHRNALSLCHLVFLK
jgi:hypothetical protein